MEKAITVYIMGRAYTLRVNPEDEEATRAIAGYVDEKMSAFRKAFPRQPEMTSAVITALAIAEELFAAREAKGPMSDETEQEINALADLLGEALKGTNGVENSKKEAG